MKDYLPLVVSVSGGKTSALMASFIQHRYTDRKIVYVFANTGMEREETLIFLNHCDKTWGLNIVWLEAEINPDGENKTRIVSFETADRTGMPFSMMIKKYGLPNLN